MPELPGTMRRNPQGKEPTLFITSDESVFYDMASAAAYALCLPDNTVREMPGSKGGKMLAEMNQEAGNEIDSLLDTLAGMP